MTRHGWASFLERERQIYLSRSRSITLPPISLLFLVLAFSHPLLSLALVLTCSHPFLSLALVLTFSHPFLSLALVLTFSHPFLSLSLSLLYGVNMGIFTLLASFSIWLPINLSLSLSLRGSLPLVTLLFSLPILLIILMNIYTIICGHLLRFGKKQWLIIIIIIIICIGNSINITAPTTKDMHTDRQTKR